MEQMSPELSVAAAQEMDSTFVDYKRFEGDADARAEQRDRFFRGETWAPEYEYPRLDRLYDYKVDQDSDNSDNPIFLMDRKADIQRAVCRLELARTNGELDPAEAELYAVFHEQRLKLIMMIEAARRLHQGSSTDVAVAREAFMELNREIFGEYNPAIYRGMLRTEYDRLQDLVPQNEAAARIKAELQQFFANKELTETEPELLDEETMRVLQEYVGQRYGRILEVVSGDENAIYDAKECREIFERALEAADLLEKGWKVVIDPKKSNPATAANKKKISLPQTMARTPSQLKRLIIHEMEVHARRGQNGIDAGSKILQKGTANYADVEEGLGVLLECVLAGDMDNPSFHRARDRYVTAGLALGIGDSPRDARQTFEMLWRLFAIREARDGVVTDDVCERAMSQAYPHVENAFRGTNFAMRGVIYTKLKIYYEGLKKNADFFKEHIEDLDAAFDIAMIGKCDHTDETEVALVAATRRPASAR